ncbi:MAG: hypothetical protein JW776_12220 [Candidatus Lokiarchaeota archaeon]|nr:hypothetical protein [Candidatus Lokiarchaeota archaeon]
MNLNKFSQVWVIIWTYFKISLVIGVQVIVFLQYSAFFHIRWILLLIEITLGFVIRMDVRKLIPLAKFITINLIPIFLIFYFVEYDWINTLVSFGDFIIKILLMLLSVVLFSETTSQYTLLLSLSKIGVPKRIAFIIMNIFSFIPILSEELRSVTLSQKARGYKFRLRNLKPILVPIILSLLDLSINLSISLESRGYEL